MDDNFIMDDIGIKLGKSQKQKKVKTKKMVNVDKMPEAYINMIDPENKKFLDQEFSSRIPLFRSGEMAAQEGNFETVCDLSNLA